MWVWALLLSMIGGLIVVQINTFLGNVIVSDEEKPRHQESCHLFTNASVNSTKFQSQGFEPTPECPAQSVRANLVHWSYLVGHHTRQPLVVMKLFVYLRLVYPICNVFNFRLLVYASVWQQTARSWHEITSDLLVDWHFWFCTNSSQSNWCPDLTNDVGVELEGNVMCIQYLQLP